MQGRRKPCLGALPLLHITQLRIELVVDIDLQPGKKSQILGSPINKDFSRHPQSLFWQIVTTVRQLARSLLQYNEAVDRVPG